MKLWQRNIRISLTELVKHRKPVGRSRITIFRDCTASTIQVSHESSGVDMGLAERSRAEEIFKCPHTRKVSSIRTVRIRHTRKMDPDYVRVLVFITCERERN